jgi:hypothetical protein
MASVIRGGGRQLARRSSVAAVDFARPRRLGADCVSGAVTVTGSRPVICSSAVERERQLRSVRRLLGLSSWWQLLRDKAETEAKWRPALGQLLSISVDKRA